MVSANGEPLSRRIANFSNVVPFRHTQKLRWSSVRAFNYRQFSRILVGTLTRFSDVESTDKTGLYTLLVQA